MCNICAQNTHNTFSWRSLIIVSLETSIPLQPLKSEMDSGSKCNWIHLSPLSIILVVFLSRWYDLCVAYLVCLFGTYFTNLILSCLLPLSCNNLFVFYWECNIIETLLPSLFSRPSHIPLPCLSFRFTVTILTNCYCMYFHAILCHGNPIFLFSRMSFLGLTNWFMLR